MTLEGLGAWGFEGFPGLPAASKPASLTMRRAVGAEPGGREKSSTKINQLAQFSLQELLFNFKTLISFRRSGDFPHAEEPGFRARG